MFVVRCSFSLVCCCWIVGVGLLLLLLSVLLLCVLRWLLGVVGVGVVVGGVAGVGAVVVVVPLCFVTVCVVFRCSFVLLRSSLVRCC